MTKLLLVRHGESEANRQDLFAGNYDADLEELGFRQAEATAEYLYDKYPVDIVYASDLKRAYKTGEVIAARFGVQIIPEPMLREISAGKWEGVKYWSLKELYPEDFNRWLTDIGNAGCTDGETLRQLAERVMTALERIAKENDGKTVVIATHATPIRVVHTMLLHGELSAMQDVPWASNASVTEINYDNGWRFVSAGADEHLGGMKTFLSKKV